MKSRQSKIRFDPLRKTVHNLVLSAILSALLGTIVIVLFGLNGGTLLLVGIVGLVTGHVCARLRQPTEARRHGSHDRHG